MNMHKFSKTAEIGEGKSHALSLKLAFISLFVASALTAMADGRETLGLWTFNGESGTYACGNKEEFVFPNRVERSDSLCLKLAWSANATTSTEAPLYTNDVQYAYLFDGVSCTNFIGECPTSAIFRHDNWANTTVDNTGSDGRANSYLTLQEVGALIKDHDWTLEMIAHFPRRNGWGSLVTLGTNTGNYASFRLRTNGRSMVNKYYTSTVNSGDKTINNSYPVYDTGASNQEYNEYVADDRWHHIAVKWSESNRELYFYVDYGLVFTESYWKNQNVNLQLDDHAQFVLFDRTSGQRSNMPTIQAVRLTRGELSVKDFLCTSKFRNPNDTVAHWRFDGKPGDIVQIVPDNSMPNRSDLRLWKSVTNDHTMAFVAPWRDYAKQGGELIKNTSAIGWSGQSLRKSKAAGTSSDFDETRTFMNVMCENPGLAAAGTGESFTHEMFVCCRTNNLYFLGKDNDKTLFFGEGFGEGGFVSQGDTANWIVSQERSGTEDGLAKIRLTYTYQDDAFSGNGTKITSDAYITTNAWHHLAVTYDAPARKVNFYVDYKSVYDNTLAEGYHMTRGTRVFGAGDQWFGYFQGFDGAIDEWRISRRALSPEEFLQQTIGPGFSIFIR